MSFLTCLMHLESTVLSEKLRIHAFPGSSRPKAAKVAPELARCPTLIARLRLGLASWVGYPQQRGGSHGYTAVLQNQTPETFQNSRFLLNDACANLSILSEPSKSLNPPEPNLCKPSSLTQPAPEPIWAETPSFLRPLLFGELNEATIKCQSTRRWHAEWHRIRIPEMSSPNLKFWENPCNKLL